MRVSERVWECLPSVWRGRKQHRDRQRGEKATEMRWECRVRGNWSSVTKFSKSEKEESLKSEREACCSEWVSEIEWERRRKLGGKGTGGTHIKHMEGWLSIKHRNQVRKPQFSFKQNRVQWTRVQYNKTHVLRTWLLCLRGRNFHLSCCHDVRLEFIILDFALQNQVSYSQVVRLLNNFENVLTNEIVWVSVLFWKKKNPRKLKSEIAYEIWK